MDIFRIKGKFAINLWDTDEVPLNPNEYSIQESSHQRNRTYPMTKVEKKNNNLKF